MKLPFFAIFVVFGIWLTIVRIRVKKKDKKSGDEFLEREKRANETPATSLDDLNYIVIPKELLPFDSSPTPEMVPSDLPPGYYDDLSEVQSILGTFTTGERPTVNLTGQTNTDLKLQYGADNLDRLTVYDQNYTLLVRSLQKWAMLLLRTHKDKEALTVLEYAVSIGTDVSGTYKELTKLYVRDRNRDALSELLEKAKEIHTPLRSSILSTIESGLSRI